MSHSTERSNKPVQLAWQHEIIDAASPKPQEPLQPAHTLGGIIVDEVYTDPTADPREVEMPGNFPYRRGIHREMYRRRPWTIRQFVGFGSPERTNERFHKLLASGQHGLSTAFDLPTLYGFDTDEDLAFGEFGKCGVAVSTIDDMSRLFEGIALDNITTSMTINGPASAIWAMFIAAAEARGISRRTLGGTLQNDILKEYHAQKEMIIPPAPAVRLVADTIEFSAEHMPRWNPVSVSGYHIREAGATAVEELAFTLADGFAYVEACLERGMDVDAFAPRMSYFFDVHNDFFEEIAKLRAARVVYAEYMRARYRARDSRSWKLRFHSQTAGVSLTDTQALNNTARVTLQAFAAVMGGTQSLHTNSFDEAVGLPTEEAVEVALRTQQIIANESGATAIADPLGGSYALEALTDTVAHEAVILIEHIRSLGGGSILRGVVDGVETGFFQKKIANSSARQQHSMEQGKGVIVGVTHFKDTVQKAPPVFDTDPGGAFEELQRERLKQFREERDQRRAQEALDNLRRGFEGTENTMPLFIDAVNAGATLGETREAMVDVFGDFTDPTFV